MKQLPHLFERRHLQPARLPTCKQQHPVSSGITRKCSGLVHYISLLSLSFLGHATDSSSSSSFTSSSFELSPQSTVVAVWETGRGRSLPSFPSLTPPPPANTQRSQQMRCCKALPLSPSSSSTRLAWLQQSAFLSREWGEGGEGEREGGGGGRAAGGKCGVEESGRKEERKKGGLESWSEESGGAWKVSFDTQKMRHLQFFSAYTQLLLFWSKCWGGGRGGEVKQESKRMLLTLPAWQSNEIILKLHAPTC